MQSRCFVRKELLVRVSDRQWTFPFLWALFAKLRKSTVSFVMSVRPTAMQQLGSHWLDFHEIWYLSIFLKSVEKIQVLLKNLTRITSTLYEDLLIFVTVCSCILLRMRNILDKSCRENQNTHFIFSDFLFTESRAVCEIMSKNMVKSERPQVTI